jgi:rRNA-processing protein FCF1
MRKIYLDTNSLMAVGEFKIDIFDELEKCCDFEFKLQILQGTLDELEKIMKTQRGKYKRAAKLAISLISVKRIMVDPAEGYVDDVLVQKSRRGLLVLTQDVILKKKLKKPYLTIRQKKKIIMVE